MGNAGVTGTHRAFPAAPGTGGGGGKLGSARQRSREEGPQLRGKGCARGALHFSCTDGAADEEGGMEGVRGMTRGHVSAAPDWKTPKENTSIFIVQ